MSICICEKSDSSFAVILLLLKLAGSN